jgi:hypothetical protein
MFNELQNVIAAFVHLAVACTFGLSLAVGVAGMMHSHSPLVPAVAVAKIPAKV